MTDVHDRKTRSRNMSAIKSRDTNPEIAVRHQLFSEGLRYRKNVNTLPGSPDIVLSKYKTCIFVNGCFWHMHRGCPFFKLPKTRTRFWEQKLLKNTERDDRAYQKLVSNGWRIIIIWECAIKGPKKLPLEEISARVRQLMSLSNVKKNIFIIE